MSCWNPGSAPFISSGRREPGHLGYFRRTLSGGVRFCLDCMPSLLISWSNLFRYIGGLPPPQQDLQFFGCSVAVLPDDTEYSLGIDHTFPSFGLSNVGPNNGRNGTSFAWGMFRKAEKNAVEIQKSVLDTIVSESLVWWRLIVVCPVVKGGFPLQVMFICCLLCSLCVCSMCLPCLCGEGFVRMRQFRAK